MGHTIMVEEWYKVIKPLNLKGIFNNSKFDKTLFIIFTYIVKFYVPVSVRRSQNLEAD